MRCPACGARNAESAQWCTQCYRSLADSPVGSQTAAAPQAGSVGERDAAPEPAAGVTFTDPAAAVATGAATASDERFRRTDEGIDWRCDVCESWNPLELTSCSVCHSPFHRTIAPVTEVAIPEVDEATVVIVSMVLPGAGHLMLKRTAAGVLRMILYVTWLVGGLALVRAAAASSQSILPATPLLLGALIVLVASAVEVQQLAGNRDLTILTPRVTLWLVAGVIGLLMVSFLGAALTASR